MLGMLESVGIVTLNVLQATSFGNCVLRFRVMKQLFPT